MSWIDDKDLAAIRSQADIVDVVSHYIQVEKKGNNHVAVCPFHDDHDPSLSISQDKQIYKCFVCGAGGDVLGFVSRIENITFRESVQKVADLVGYQLRTRYVPQEKKESEHQKQFDLMQTYIDFLKYELDASQDLALNYLNQRKINANIRDIFSIGYAPSSSRSMQFLKAKGYTDQDLMDTGLMNEKGDAVFYDRIMIPIHDENGNPIAFTARTMRKDKNVPKYINSGRTVIYDKGDIVFNYHRAKEAARKEKRVILCEGAMDVIAFEKAGIHEAIANLGTACTSKQLSLIKNLHVPVYICYDGDQAGQNAAYHFAQKAVQAHIDIQVVVANGTKDPDDIYNESSAEGLQKFVSKTQSYVDFLILDIYQARTT